MDTQAAIQQYLKQLADKIEQALMTVESLDWYKKLPDPDKAHIRTILFDAGGDLRFKDNTPQAAGLDPTERLILSMAVITTAYEIQIIEATEGILSEQRRRQSGLILPNSN